MKIHFLIVLTFLALWCGGCHKSGVEGAHEHEDFLQITGYCPDFEVFAEATPFVVGDESELLVHVTHLPDFKPLDKGNVTVSLIVGDSGVRQTVDSPLRPGVFIFSLTPKRAGEAKVIFDIKTNAGSARVVVDGFRVYTDHHEAEEAAERATVKSSNAVAFTKEMSWKVDFSTEPVKSIAMEQIIRTMGQVQPSQGDVRTVTALSSGILTYISGGLTDGQAVSVGQGLFRIDASGMADDNLRVRFLEAKSNFEVAKREYERKSELAKEKLVTESELLRAKQEYENASAVYSNLQHGFSSGGSVAASPISGYITQLLVTNGQFVEAGQPLATVAQNRDLFIKAEVAPSYYPYLSSITGAQIRRPNSSDTYSLSDLKGTVVSYGKSVDAENPLIPVVFRVNNASGLIPGTFVEMYIRAGNEDASLAVPNASLIEEMGNYFVYVQLTPEYFEKREVRPGRNDGLYTEILDGLKEGERVVAKGAVLVKLAQSTGSLDAHSGHVH